MGLLRIPAEHRMHAVLWFRILEVPGGTDVQLEAINAYGKWRLNRERRGPTLFEARDEHKQAKVKLPLDGMPSNDQRHYTIEQLAMLPVCEQFPYGVNWKLVPVPKSPASTMPASSAEPGCDAAGIASADLERLPPKFATPKRHVRSADKNQPPEIKSKPNEHRRAKNAYEESCGRGVINELRSVLTREAGSKNAVIRHARGNRFHTDLRKDAVLELACMAPLMKSYSASTLTRALSKFFKFPRGRPIVELEPVQPTSPKRKIKRR